MDKKFFFLPVIYKTITFVTLLSIMPLVLAKLPHASQITTIKGKQVMFQQGKQRPIAAQIGQRLENQNQTLVIPGDKTALARLIFLGGDNNYNGLLLQAGPDFRQTQYRFPCNLGNGKITVGWRQGKDRGCEEGIYLSPIYSSTQNKEIPESEFSKSLENSILFKPRNDKQTLVQANTEDNQQEIQALIGDVIIITPNTPQGLLITEGEKYIYQNGKEKREPIDIELILNLPEIQDFFQPKNWTLDTIQKPITTEISEQLNSLLNPHIDASSFISVACQNKVDTYLNNVKVLLNNTWSPPKPPNQGVWKTFLTYEITREGKVENIEIKGSSGYEAFDQAAVDHVHSLEQNLTPFPSCYPRKFLPVDHTFKLTYY